MFNIHGKILAFDVGKKTYWKAKYIEMQHLSALMGWEMS